MGRKSGFKHSEETRKKMSESRQKEKHYLWGKHRFEETKKKISESEKGTKRSTITGSKNYL